MRRLTVAYSLAAIWTFGWLTGTFGLMPSLLAAFVLFLPVGFAWRMLASNRTAKRREYGYLAVATVFAVGAAVFFAITWYDTGMDRLAMFDREYRAFRRHVASLPEFRNVDISCTRRKDRRVYLHGSVETRGDHERLLQLIEWMVRNNNSGYFDGVEYPGKADDPARELSAPNGDELRRARADWKWFDDERVRIPPG